MKPTYLLLLGALLSFCPQDIQAQEAEEVDPIHQPIFTDKDKDFLQMWYYEQILKMDLDEDGRDNYRTLLTYYTYRMGKLPLPKYEYSDAEQKKRFDALVVKCNEEMKELLTEANYAIHLKSFTTIVEKVYKAKEWAK